MPPEVEAALQRARVPHDAHGRGAAGGRLRAHRAGAPAAGADEPGLAGQAADHAGRARPARPRLDLEHAGVAAGQRQRRRARRLAGHQGQRRPEAGDRTRVADAAPRAAAGRARDPRRHRARPQRLRAQPGRPGRLRRRPHTPLQRAARRAAAQLQGRDLQLRARPGARRGAGAGRSAAGRHAGGAHGAAVGRALRRLAQRAQGRASPMPAGALRRQLPGRLRRAALAGGRRRPGQLQRAPDRSAVARHGRQAVRARASTAAPRSASSPASS